MSANPQPDAGPAQARATRNATGVVDARLRPVADVARDLGLAEDDVIPFGRHKAKVSLRALVDDDGQPRAPRGRYVVVTAMTPTPRGEGKTVTTIGAALGLNAIGKRAVVCIRQPSMGPIFGIKGGAAGGGRSQVLPAETVNLHLTGDMHAVSAAHNLCAAFLDNHLAHGDALGIDPNRIVLPRVVDLNDRALRDIAIGLGGPKNGVVRQSGFEITPASEVMAILALADGYADLRARLARMTVAFDRGGKPVTADDLNVAGAMGAVLRDALKPNLLQTSEGTPALIHTGPFGNIAHGNSSVLADRLALAYADYCVTEAGFGADMGAEKFFNIKCRSSGLVPHCAVLVATVRALKFHSGRFTARHAKDEGSVLYKENVEAVEAGAPNLAAQVANVDAHGVPVVVAINRFASDTQAEVDAAKAAAKAAGAERVVVCDVFERGGEGGAELARAIVELAEGNDGSGFQYAYPLDAPIEDKVHALATKFYGADGVDFLPDARHSIARWRAAGIDGLAVCMAKTQASLSHDPKLLGAPRGYRFVVRDVHASTGAGFATPIAGEMNLMPGLPKRPGGERIDIDPDGTITGLF